jgi:uncharacterized membrane protein
MTLAPLDPLLASSTITFNNGSWAGVTILLLIGAAVALTLTYRSTVLQGWRKVLALALKGFGFVLLALTLLEPIRLEQQPKPHANELVLLADNSAGLTIPLHQDAVSPGDMLRQSLGADRFDEKGVATAPAPAWWVALGDLFQLHPYRFSDGVRPCANFAELNFAGTSSALVGSLEDIRSRFANRPLAAIVMLTDGNATDLARLADFEAEQKDASRGKAIPVYPVMVGEDNPAAFDLALTEVTASTTAFEDAQVQVSVTLMARGEVTEPVTVYAVDDSGKEIASEIMSVPPGNGAREFPARLSLPVSAPGISFLNIGVRSAEGITTPELTDRNNQRELAVDRGRGPYRILYVSGRPNWEYKFLRRALTADAELDLVGLIRIAKREPQFEWRGRTGESGNPLFRGFGGVAEETQRYDEPVLIRLNTSSPAELRDGFPKTAEDLFSSYRAIVLDDIEADFFNQEQLELIEAFVSQRGGTVMMLGGQESFQQGKWENTPVSRLLPVYLDPLGKADAVLDATWDLTREGWLEPWMRHRSDTEQENIRLAYMTPFFSINQLSAIKPGASLLATVTDPNGRVLPALTVQRYGNGRSAALAVADLWRWGMKDAEQQAEMGRAWRQLFRWAVAETPTRVELRELSDEAAPSALTRVSVQVRTPAFDPQDDASVVLTAIKRDGTKTILPVEPSLEEPGAFTAEYLNPGGRGFRIEARVRDASGQEIGQDEFAAARNYEAAEFARLGPNPEPLARIAAATGGRLLSLAELDQLPALLGELDFPITEVRQHPLWHTPWLFLAALLCFLGEWTLRRRQGIL